MINHFTHTDLDGVSCAVLSHLFARQNDASIIVNYCDRGKNRNIDCAVNKLLDLIDLSKSESVKPRPRLVIISDISITNETAERLNEYRSDDFHILMVDHHMPNDFVQYVPWAHINTSPETCATKLLYEKLQEFILHGEIRLRGSWAMDMFVNDVCRYDTWSFEVDDNSYQLNVLLGLLGMDRFRSFACGMLSEHRPMIVSQTMYTDVITNISDERKAYCNMKASTVQKVQLTGKRIGVVFAERYISQLADTVLKKYPDLDACAVVNMPASVSLRSRKDSDCDVGELARCLGGGGHANASAYLIDKPDEFFIKRLLFIKTQEVDTVGEEAN